MESLECWQRSSVVFDVRFAVLVLRQVCCCLYSEDERPGERRRHHPAEAVTWGVRLISCRVEQSVTSKE